MDVDAVFGPLSAWVERGWLRPLDRALVRFFHEQDPQAEAPALVGAALASHQLGRGHICLDLSRVLEDPRGVLALPPEGEPVSFAPDGPEKLLEGFTRQGWAEALRRSALVDDGAGNAPLVLSRERLYLRRYWEYTRSVAEKIRERLDRSAPVPGDLPRRLDRVFIALRSPGEREKTEIHWQSVAAAMAASGAFTVISGGPGTGKTTAVVRILGLLQEAALETGRPLRIHLAAPTGKAAARLSEALGGAVAQLPESLRPYIPGEAATLHRLLGGRPDTRRFVHNGQNPLHGDLVVVDEASMIDLELMASLMDALPEHARLILLGDKDQLASVEAGSVLGDLCRNAETPGYRPETAARIEQETGYFLEDWTGPGSMLDQRIVLLRKNHRFGEESGIGALAAAVNTGSEKAVAAIWEKGFDDIETIFLTSREDSALADLVRSRRAAGSGGPEPLKKTGGYRAYLERLDQGPLPGESETAWARAVLDRFQRFQLLSPLRRGDWGVRGLNENVAAILFRAGLIPAEQGWYPGRPVLVTRNDYGLGLMNGDVGVAMPMADPENPERTVLRVAFPTPDRGLKTVNPGRLDAVETVFAMTVHKSQGSEFEHVVLVLPETPGPFLTRELIYTAVTRASRRFTLAGPRPEILAQGVSRRTRRASGLADLLAALDDTDFTAGTSLAKECP